MNKQTLLVAILITFSCTTNAQKIIVADNYSKSFNNNYLAIQKGAYWGYIDTLGNEVTPFADAGFDNGIIGKPSSFILNPNFYTAYNTKDELTNLYDKTGKLITNKYHRIYGLSDSISLAVKKVFNGTKYSAQTLVPTYITATGKEVIKLSNNNAGKIFFLADNIGKFYGYFQEGLSYVPYSGEEKFSSQILFGYINTKGTAVIKPVYKKVNNFYEGLAVVNKVNELGVEKWGVINKQGKEIAPFIFTNEPSKFVNGYSIIQNAMNLYGYLHAKGNIIIEPKYFFASSFNNNKAIVIEGSDWLNAIIKVIDTAGNTIKKIGKNYEYEFVDFMGRERPFFENDILICKKGKEDSKAYGGLDSSGKEAIPFIYEHLEPFSCGRAYAETEDKKGFIDTKGNWIIILTKPQF